MANSKPVGLNASKAAISKLAEEFAEKVGYHPQRNDIFSVIKTLGGKVEYRGVSRLLGEHDASLRVDSKDSFTIILSALCGQDRNRFSAAHELAHFILHYIIAGRKDVMEAARSGNSQDRAEWEANWFAGAFLMPEKEFREIYKMGANYAAGYFEVSVAAVDVRAKTLGST